MLELEKILEELKRIKDGNRKEKLYAKYPPNSKDQEAVILLNRECDGYREKIRSLEKMIYKLNDPVFIPSPEERICSECIADLPEDILKKVHTVRIEPDGAVTMYLDKE